MQLLDISSNKEVIQTQLFSLNLAIECITIIQTHLFSLNLEI